VEIIKREYLKTLDTGHSTQLSGLYQYNEIGYLEDLDLDRPRDDYGIEDLTYALSGKHTRQKQTPFMKITLCPAPIPELSSQEITSQQPLKRRLSRSAKARVKKRRKNAQFDETGTSTDTVSLLF